MKEELKQAIYEAWCINEINVPKLISEKLFNHIAEIILSDPSILRHADLDVIKQAGWVREEEELEFVLPKGYFNVGITTDYKYLIADTNDSSNWDQIKIPLPKGRWVIKSKIGKCIIIINQPATK